MEAKKAHGCEQPEYSDPRPDANSVSIRIYVPELNIQKVLHFSLEELVWNVKQQCLATLPKVSGPFNLCNLYYIL